MRERLQKIMARAGLASRRKAEELIQQGRVLINGQVVTRLGTKADPAEDIIEVNGRPVEQAENKVYILLNKPHGYITSRYDPEGRPTVLTLLSDITERIFPVGRLDYDTEGLLILTNDGQFAQTLQHPRHQVERKYLVKVKSMPTQKTLSRIKEGVHIDGEKTIGTKVKIIGKMQRNTWLEIVLTEGKYRHIKKIFEAVGHRTLRIKRISFGPIHLGKLPQGSYRFLTKRELDSVKKLIVQSLHSSRNGRAVRAKQANRDEYS